MSPSDTKSCRLANSAVTANYNVAYHSSRQPEVELFADVYHPATPAPLLLTFHSWHGDRTSFRPLAELLGTHFVVVNVDMRGRGKSTGTPDVNGWELLDAIDAVNHVRQIWAEKISNPATAYCLGVGGGGGNVYAALAKFPGFFAAGVAINGVSDYALWYKSNLTGEFRDEMALWIGADPYDNHTAYKARSGLHLLPNVQAPILAIHGVEDSVVPVAMSRLLERRAADCGVQASCIEVPFAGHTIKLARYVDTIWEFLTQHQEPAAPPFAGRWCVGGYIQTVCQRLELASMNDFCIVDYRLDTQGRIVWCQAANQDMLALANIVSLA